MPDGNAITLDFSKAQPIQQPQAQAGGVALDFPKAQPVTAPGQPVNPGFTEMMQHIQLAGKGGKQLPGESVADALSRVDRARTLDNMTHAMSGQPLTNPEDQAVAERARKDGMIAAAVTAATTGLGDLLLAPGAANVLSKIPAGRDPVTGRILPWVVKTATTEGPSLAKAGYDAIQAAGEAHPLVRQVLAYGLASIGAGKIANALGWLGANAK